MLDRTKYQHTRTHTHIHTGTVCSVNKCYNAVRYGTRFPKYDMVWVSDFLYVVKICTNNTYPENVHVHDKICVPVILWYSGKILLFWWLLLFYYSVNMLGADQHCQCLSYILVSTSSLFLEHKKVHIRIQLWYQNKHFND